MSVAEEFAYLTGVGPQPATGTFNVRRLGGLDGSFVGLDDAGSRHLLLPVGDLPVTEDSQSAHVTVTERTMLSDNGTALRFADLSCSDPALMAVFELLAEDVLVRVAGGVRANVVCQMALGDWRELLRRDRQSLSREAVIGLYGELYVLSMQAAGDPSTALEAWVGPSGRTHDFERQGRELEVKTTASVDGNAVRISNLDQLDPGPSTSLDLVVIHVREGGQGPTLLNLVDSIIERGVSRHALLAKLVEAGYQYGAPEPLRLEFRSARVWHVGDAFPGIRASDIPPDRRSSVTEVNYTLVLPKMPDISGDAVSGFLGGWATQ